MKLLPQRSHASQLGLTARLLLAYVVLFATYALLFQDESVARRWVIDIGQMVAPLVAALLCLKASRSSASRRLRLSWMSLALSSVAWVLGQSTWSYYELILSIASPVGTPADIFFAAQYPLVLAGLLLHFPPRRDRSGIPTTIFDALLFTLAVGGLIWHLILAPSLAAAEDPGMAALSVASPIGDLLVVFAMVSKVLRLPLDRVPASSFYILGGLVLQVIVDILFTILILQGSYHTGSPLDSLWQWSYLLIGYAAVAHLKCRSREREEGDGWRETINIGWTRGLRMVLPYFALPVSLILLYHSFNPRPDDSEANIVVAFGTAIVLVALVMLRQLMVLLENQRLSTSLVALSQDLEFGVARRTAELTLRTKELAALNEVATRLSQCVNLDDVIEAGPQLACSATGSSGCAMWLLRPGRDAEMVGHGRLSESALKALSQPAFLSREIEKVTASGQGVAISGDELPEAVRQQGFSCLVAVPLISRGSVLGVLGLFRGGGREMEGSTLSMSRAIGAQLGVALEGARRYEDAKYLADRDPVTGLLNHRAIHQRLEQELKRAQRGGEEAALVIMDIDGFKLFNDTYGHPMGDQVLKNVAALMHENARSSDVIGRYGGDEFVAILPQTGMEGAIIFAERLRAALAVSPCLPDSDQRVPLHLSFGVAIYPHDGRQVQDLVGFADTNLYESKAQGGDTVTVGDHSEREIAKMGNYGVLDGLVVAVDNKDRYTRKHSKDVTDYALALAAALGLSEESQRTLRIAGLLHDVGKIAIPDRILRKPGRLTDEEFEIVKQHPVMGEMIIKDVPNIDEVVAAVGSHHERCDGHGYPRGLEQDEIPLLGRILAVADAFSAMTTDRPYRKALAGDEARSELLRVAGTQLDPELVRAFLQLPLASDTDGTVAAAVS